MVQKTNGKNIEKWNKTGKDILYHLSMAILVTVFMASGGMLLKRYVMEQKHKADLDHMISMFPDTDTPWLGEDAGAAGPGRSDDAGDIRYRQRVKNDDSRLTAMWIPPHEWKLWWEREAERRFVAYRGLEEQNPDMAGWIRIEGTRIDYPVMQTPDDPDYYLHRDFHKKKSIYGVPYIAGSCRDEEPAVNLLIYGHHMRNGEMFAALAGYSEESFYRKHPYIQFDSVDKAGSYEVAAVLKVEASGDMTLWEDLLFPGEETSWEDAWEDVRSQAFYQTGVRLEYGDRLLALVTCEYTLKDGRLMVVAREIR